MYQIKFIKGLNPMLFEIQLLNRIQAAQVRVHAKL